MNKPDTSAELQPKIKPVCKFCCMCVEDFCRLDSGDFCSDCNDMEAYIQQEVIAARMDELKSLEYIDWEEYSPDGSGINELFDPCIQAYIEHSLAELKQQGEGK